MNDQTTWIKTQENANKNGGKKSKKNGRVPTLTEGQYILNTFGKIG